MEFYPLLANLLLFVLKIFTKEFYLCLRVHSKSTALKFIKLGDVLLRVRLKYFYAHALHPAAVR